MNDIVSINEVLSYGPVSDPKQHAKRVTEAVNAIGTVPATTCPVESWQRCIQDFKLDPAEPLHLETFVGNRALNDARDALGEEINLASDELHDLYSMVAPLGYSTGFANREGLFMLEQADRSLDSYVSTDQPGWMWPERLGGTNSVGTCIIEEKPTSVFGRQHFFSCCIDTACAGAPVFDSDGKLCGVLSISIRDRRLQPQTHSLAGEIVRQSAARLSAKLFRRAFSASMILEWEDSTGLQSMIAVNADQHIEGANRAARKNLNLNEIQSSKSLWGVFERNVQFRRAKVDGGEIDLRMLRNGTIFQANVTPAPPSRWRQPVSAAIGERSTTQTSKSVSLQECAGADPFMGRQVTILEQVKNSGLPILLLGETGTGKDTLARAIHSAGARADRAFVAFNCAAVPESLIDSELFGYAPGTFTGASPSGNRGRILEADGGTLFLDEIGDMPLSLQTRLLRVLENQEVVALGTGTPRKVDVNIIAATHQDLYKHVSEGRFRQDLFYRLAGAVVELPPLRERTDLRAIVENMLDRLAGPSKHLDQAAMDSLIRHSWPGNLRELNHVLRRALSVNANNVITETDLMFLPIQMRTIGQRAALGQRCGKGREPGRHVGSEAEADSIKVALGKTLGDVDAAAKLLGVSRATFYRKMQRNNVQRN